MKKKDNWCLTRHKVVTALLRPFLSLYVRWKYNLKLEKFRDQGKRPYLVLANHQTGFDQFFVGMMFNRPVYYLASEDIFSMGWVSRLIRWLVAPIPINKEGTDIQAIKNCIRVAREGGTICLFPEGNRTYHGKTIFMRASVVPLIKKLKLPVALMRIEGGYGVQPRWSNVIRKGKMRCFVSQVIEPEDYSAMTNEEMFQKIRDGLWVDETAMGGEFVHKNNAEFLERVVYTCPTCGFTKWESHGDTVTCCTCGCSVRHRADRTLEGIGFDFPHRHVADWYESQNDFVNRTDLLAMTAEPVFTDKAQLSLVHVYQRKEVLKQEAAICLYGDRLTIDERVIPFDQISGIAVLGKNKLGIKVGTEFLQLKGDDRFNSLKYMNFYYRHKNLTTEGPYEDFLGL